MDTLGKILVVDDEEIFCTVLAASLQHKGYTVRSAISGREAIEALNREYFDTVITDLQMQEINGYDVAHHVKGCSAQTTVILITGGDCSKIEGEALEQGVDVLFQKPFAVEDLLPYLPPQQTTPGRSSRRRPPADRTENADNGAKSD